MHTSYAQRSTIVHPSMGAWMTKLDGRFNPTLPGAVVVNGGSRHPLSGFLPSAHQPLAIGNPNEGLRNCKMLKGFSEQGFEKSLELSHKLDRNFVQKYDLKKVRAYSDMYDDAVRLMKSRDLKAFDLSEEPDALRDAYGDDNFGQGVFWPVDLWNDKCDSWRFSSGDGTPTKTISPGSRENRDPGSGSSALLDDLTNAACSTKLLSFWRRNSDGLRIST